jgi:ATP-dependent helicase HrpB
VKLSLPVDARLDEIVARLRSDHGLVLQAPPGSGKTTRVPAALATTGVFGGVCVLEPRRLAARAAARRVAFESGTNVGDQVGYVVRHQRAVSARTRLRFVTEGVLLRQLVADPFLAGIGCVVLDEFHERHVEGDLTLAMLREVQQTVRPELKIVVMSATLEPEPLLRFLGASLLSISGSLHPVRTAHEPQAAGRDLELLVRDAVLRALRETDGDVLVFLPGVREIADAQAALATTARRGELLVLPLHGQLEPEQQDLAIQKQSQRKVVLATNVAESSLTIEGVTAVVDSGLARVLRHDPGRGLDVLRLERISLASADQRRGRAGRVTAGVCYRLWGAGEERGMPPADVPEILRVDLAGPALAIRAFAGRDPALFHWFEAPEPAALQRADALLRLLGAIDERGAVTGTGREMLELPLHPRLARVVVEGKRLGVPRAAAGIAALLAERDPLRRGAGADLAAESGLWLRLMLLDEFEAGGGRTAHAGQLGLDPGAAHAIARARAQLAGQAAADRSHDDAELAAVVLAGFPDRVGRRTAPDEGTLVGGRPVRLQRGALTSTADLFVAVAARDVAERSGKSLVELAVPITRAQLAAVHPQLLATRDEVDLDEARGRAVAVRRTRFCGLALDEARGGEPDPEQTRTLLGELLLRDPWRYLGEQRELRGVLARIAWLRSQDQDLGLPAVDDRFVGELAASMLAGATGLKGLADVDLAAAWLAREPALRALLAREAPDRIRLPSGRLALVDYSAPGGPAVAARLQEWFGMPSVPPLARGRVPLVLHLLAPNQRPVQITRDLASFWRNVYPRVRAELMRRYPRHSWPEDPLTATPQARPRRRPR